MAPMMHVGLKRLLFWLSGVIAFFDTLIFVLVLLTAEENSGSNDDQDSGDSNNDSNDGTSSKGSSVSRLAAGGSMVFTDFNSVFLNTVFVFSFADELDWLSKSLESRESEG